MRVRRPLFQRRVNVNESLTDEKPVSGAGKASRERIGHSPINYFEKSRAWATSSAGGEILSSPEEFRRTPQKAPQRNLRSLNGCWKHHPQMVEIVSARGAMKERNLDPPDNIEPRCRGTELI